jgi:putative transposase
MGEARIPGEQTEPAGEHTGNAQGQMLADIAPEERERAWQRYQVLSPYLHEHVPLAEVARAHHLPLKTVQRWVRRYREEQLVGLARRRRSDRGVRRRIPPECEQVIQGMALLSPGCSIAQMHREIMVLAKQRGWPEISYESVYGVVRAIPAALRVLAQEGTRVYQERYDLLFLQEVARPNERWQADHCVLNIWLRDEQGEARRPYLTIIMDEYSRAIMGYRLSFDAPSAYQTGLTLRQAIGKKDDVCWPVCGIPDTLYTDHGCDFTSKQMEQVAGQLSMHLIFSQVGRPRGRGKVERFFRSVKQMVLPGLPG